MTNQLSSQELGIYYLEPLTHVAPSAFADFRSVRLDPGSRNVSRDIRKQFLKACKWPSCYQARVRTWNPRTKKEQLEYVNFLLPHEMFHVLVRVSDREKIFDTSGLDVESHNYLKDTEKLAGGELLAIGVWSDGVPNNWDRSDSVELIQVNLPGLGKEYSDLRVPVCAFPKCRMCDGTYHDCLEIVRWSLACMDKGVFPSVRHDGTAWTAHDCQRRRKSGQQLGYRGALVLVRGDWLAYKTTFHLPGWADAGRCCWLCACSLPEVAGRANLIEPTPLGH